MAKRGGVPITEWKVHRTVGSDSHRTVGSDSHHIGAKTCNLCTSDKSCGVHVHYVFACVQWHHMASYDR
jgi:hypothetical protein